MSKHADSKRRDSAQSQVKAARKQAQRNRAEIERFNALVAR